MNYFLLLPLALACLGHANVYYGERQPYTPQDVHEGNGTVEVPGSVNDSRVEEANDYIDTVLQQKLPHLFNRSSKLYPSAPIPPFTFTVYKTAITNRDLKVNVTEGAFKNFDSAVSRVGDCNPVVEERNTSISCTLKFDGITADLVAVTQGDDIFGTVKTVNVEAVVYDTTGRLEVTRTKYRPGYLRTYYVENVNFNIKTSDNLHLNNVRMRNFKTFITKELKEDFYSKIYGAYKILLRHACRRGSPLFN